MSFMYNTADSKAGENHRDHKNTQSIYTYIYLLPITYLLSLQIHNTSLSSILMSTTIPTRSQTISTYYVDISHIICL